MCWVFESEKKLMDCLFRNFILFSGFSSSCCFFSVSVLYLFQSIVWTRWRWVHVAALSFAGTLTLHQVCVRNSSMEDVNKTTTTTCPKRSVQKPVMVQQVQHEHFIHVHYSWSPSCSPLCNWWPTPWCSSKGGSLVLTDRWWSVGEELSMPPEEVESLMEMCVVQVRSAEMCT